MIQYLHFRILEFPLNLCHAGKNIEIGAPLFAKLVYNSNNYSYSYIDICYKPKVIAVVKQVSSTLGKQLEHGDSQHEQFKSRNVGTNQVN